jgi:hypothetical protein
MKPTLIDLPKKNEFACNHCGDMFLLIDDVYITQYNRGEVFLLHKECKIHYE